MKKDERNMLAATSATTTGVLMGTVVAFMLNKNSIPPGWLLCDGSEIPSQYQNLITALGSNYTPNLAGRTLIGTGVPSNSTQSDGRSPNFDPANNWPLGYTGGEYQNTLSENQMPSHQHLGWGEHDSCPWGTGNSTSRNNFGAHSNDTDNYLYGSTFTGGNITQNIVETTNGTITATSPGTTAPHNNMQPYYAVNYIIYTGQ